jgi:hypothetical protein
MSTARVQPVVATASQRSQESESEPKLAQTYECDLCAQSFQGPPAGSGLFLWSRGDELRIEEPPLCEECATRITIGALMKWQLEEEEEG